MLQGKEKTAELESGESCPNSHECDNLCAYAEKVNRKRRTGAVNAKQQPGLAAGEEAGSKRRKCT